LNDEVDVKTVDPGRLIERASELAKVKLKEPFYAPADVYAGAAAVALVKFPDWLESNPDARNAILDFFRRAAKHARVSFSHVERCQIFADDRFYGFASDVVPMLWRRFPDDMTFRHFVGKLACGTNDHSVGRLLQAIVREFGPESGEIREVSHLVVRFSRILLLLFRMRNPDQAAREEVVNKILEDFDDGRLGPLVGEWWNVVSSWPGEMHRRESHPTDAKFNAGETIDGVDEDYIFLAFSWLYDRNRMASGFTPFEQELLFGLWRILLFCRESWNREDASARFDLRSAFAFVDALGRAVLVAESWAFPEEILRELGTHGDFDVQAARYVLAFLGDFGFDNVELWKKTVMCLERAFAILKESSPWEGDHDRAREGDDLLCAVVGLDGYRSSEWSAERRGLVDLLTPLFADWATVALGRNDCARSFIRFLASDAAIPLRPQGLRWLSHSEKRGWWKGSDILVDLVSLLARHLKGSGQGLRADSETREAFVDLLHYAVAQGEPSAIALEEEARLRLGSKAGPEVD
jgi:hypothetical protein